MDDSKMAAILDELDSTLREVEALRPLPSAVEMKVFQRLRLEWNYHTNALEGNSLTFGEAAAFLMHGLTANGKPFKDYLDIKGHDKVIDVLADVVRHAEPLTESLVRNLHAILLVEPYEVQGISPEGLPTIRRVEVGTYKSTQNHVLTQTGQLKTFSSPAETPAEMEKLFAWYRQELVDKNLHPVVFASILHHRFVSIHPFDDGNGRLARVLMNLVLMQAKLLPAIIKTEQKGSYLLALSKADVGEPEELVRLIGGAVLNSAKLYLKAAGGELIDGLDSFDMRLALIRQSAQSNSDAGDAHSAKDQHAVLDGFVVPLLKSISQRFKHVDPLFAETEARVHCKADGRNVALSGATISEQIDSLAAAPLDSLLSSVQLFYNCSGYINDAQRTFLCSLIIYFTPGRLSVTLQLTGRPVAQIFETQIAELPGSEQARQVAKDALDKFTHALERVIAA